MRHHRVSPTRIDMAIKFSAKDQPAAAAATAKLAKPAAAPKADEPAEDATDLFKSPAEVASRKTRKKK
jgi:hypothetical protein